MKQGKFGRIVVALSALATLGLAWVGVDGYRMGEADADLQRHLGSAMGVILALLFGHCWVTLYLSGMAHTLRRAEADESLAESAWSWRQKRPLRVSITLALILLLAVFLLGPAAMLEMLPAWAHGVVFFAALAAQILALTLETRALRTADAQLAALHERLS